MWLSVCSAVCFTVLMMESQPSADNLCLFYGLLPSCSMWAINLSPAVSKQCSNQWEIISANRWASLSISPSLCLSCCPICILSPSTPPSLSLSSSLLSHFLLSLCFFHPLPHSPPSPTFTCVPSSSLSAYSEMRQLSSSRAINKSRLHPWNM